MNVCIVLNTYYLLLLDTGEFSRMVEPHEYMFTGRVSMNKVDTGKEEGNKKLCSCNNFYASFFCPFLYCICIQL